MKRVLLVGFDPATVDFSDPAAAGRPRRRSKLDQARARRYGRGWQAESCFINPDETAVPTVERRLAGGRYDCVVVGAASACRRASWRCSRRWSTPSTAPRRKRPSRSTPAPRTPARRPRADLTAPSAPGEPRDSGCRREVSSPRENRLLVGATPVDGPTSSVASPATASWRRSAPPSLGAHVAGAALPLRAQPALARYQDRDYLIVCPIRRLRAR